MLTAPPHPICLIGSSALCLPALPLSDLCGLPRRVSRLLLLTLVLLRASRCLSICLLVVTGIGILRRYVTGHMTLVPSARSFLGYLVSAVATCIGCPAPPGNLRPCSDPLLT